MLSPGDAQSTAALGGLVCCEVLTSLAPKVGKK